MTQLIPAIDLLKQVRQPSDQEPLDTALRLDRRFRAGGVLALHKICCEF